jgi:hypothetical protein
MGSKYETPFHERLSAKRAVWALKIKQERHALLNGEMLVSAPAEYKHIKGQTRVQRLAAWEAILVEIDEQIANSEKQAIAAPARTPKSQLPRVKR